MRPIGSHTQRSDLASAQTISVPDGATHVLMQCATQNVRVTFDGTTPTATKGFLLTAGATPLPPYPVPAGGSILAIEVTTTAVFDYQFISKS